MEILTYIGDKFPELALTVISAYIAWKLSRWTKEVEETKKDLGKLECDERKSEIESVQSQIKDALDEFPKLQCAQHFKSITDNKLDFDVRLTELNGSLNAHTERITSVENRLRRWDDKMIDIALSTALSAKKESPYSKTPYGDFILLKSFGKSCIDDNREYFFNLIDEQPHTTPYDVERSALGIVMDAFSTDITNSVKNFLYNAPSRIEFNEKMQEIKTTDIQVAMAIYLRDLYLERNSEIGKLTPSEEEKGTE